jgi:hypothetical protein
MAGDSATPRRADPVSPHAAEKRDKRMEKGKACEGGMAS